MQICLFPLLKSLSQQQWNANGACTKCTARTSCWWIIIIAEHETMVKKSQTRTESKLIFSSLVGRDDESTSRQTLFRIFFTTETEPTVTQTSSTREHRRPNRARIFFFTFNFSLFTNLFLTLLFQRWPSENSFLIIFFFLCLNEKERRKNKKT